MIHLVGIVDLNQSISTEPVFINFLQCESLQNPIGLDEKRPRLSWKLESKRRGVYQKAYQVQVSKTVNLLEACEAFVWDSGKVVSNDSVHLIYAGSELASRQRYFWRVRIWDEHDRISAWSPTAYDRYLQYQTYDVTQIIQPGANVIGGILADGWYCGRIGLPGDSCNYGNKLAFHKRILGIRLFV